MFWFIVTLCCGNLFQAKYIYKLLKYGLFKYPAWVSFTVTGKCVSFNTFIYIIFNMSSKSACLGKYLCPKFLLFACMCSLGDSYLQS